MFTKKAQGLSMNTIIIAAIALVVLVVLIVLVMNYTGKVPEATSCENQGGRCVPPLTDENRFDTCSSGRSPLKADVSYAPHAAKCPTEGDVCCLGIGG